MSLLRILITNLPPSSSVYCTVTVSPLKTTFLSDVQSDCLSRQLVPRFAVPSLVVPPVAALHRPTLIHYATYTAHQQPQPVYKPFDKLHARIDVSCYSELVYLYASRLNRLFVFLILPAYPTKRYAVL